MALIAKHVKQAFSLASIAFWTRQSNGIYAVFSTSLMLTISCSSSPSEIALTAYEWPSTTTPWVVATARVLHEGTDPTLRTFTFDSGVRAVGWMIARSSYSFFSVECYLLEGGEWTKHSVDEVLLGYIGETPVAVFRDSAGVDFCPDAPEVPPSKLSNLKLICNVNQGAASPASAQPA